MTIKMYWLWRNFIISTLLAFGIYSFIFFSETGAWPLFREHWEGLVLAIFLANIGGVGFYFVSKQFNSTIPWNQKRTIRFAAEIFTGLIIFSMLALLFYFILISPNVLVEEESTFWANYWDGIVKFGILLTVLLYVYSLVNFSIFSYNQYAVVQIESLSTERDQLNLQFEALKSQLNPHFLFNSLNTISSLTYRDVKLAEKYIRKLASTYRYILRTDDKQLVSLEEELNMVRSFFFMQQIKYEDCIFLETTISEKNINSLIPPLTVQMLVENALKHNLICEEKDLKIEIFDENDKIVVKNNLVKKPILLRVGNDVFDRPAENGSHKIGLENIRKRYNYLVNKEIEIIRNDHFIVKLPVINMNFEKTSIL